MNRCMPIGAAGDEAAGRLDLNLLAVFDVVMTERHVTRSAERLAMTQSAVSNALNRLRKLFEDQLFVKAPRGVLPTPKALALWPRIHESLEQLRETVQPDGFDARRARQRFRISMVDLPAALLTSRLYRNVHEQAPHTVLFFVPPDPMLTSHRLMRGEIDFAVSIEPPRAATVQAIPLWSDSYVVTARRGHPLFERELDIASFCATPQLAVNLPGNEDLSSTVDDALSDMGLARAALLSVNQFAVAAAILRDSDLIAVLPRRCVMINDGALAFRPLPFSIPNVVLYLSWHQRSNAIASHQWFKQRVLEAVQELDGAASRNLPSSEIRAVT